MTRKKASHKKATSSAKPLARAQNVVRKDSTVQANEPKLQVVESSSNAQEARKEVGMSGKASGASQQPTSMDRKAMLDRFHQTLVQNYKPHSKEMLKRLNRFQPSQEEDTSDNGASSADESDDDDSVDFSQYEDAESIQKAREELHAKLDRIESGLLEHVKPLQLYLDFHRRPPPPPSPYVRISGLLTNSASADVSERRLASIHVSSVKFEDLTEKGQYAFAQGLDRMTTFVERPTRENHFISMEDAVAIADTALYFWNYYSKEIVMPKSWDLASKELVAQYLHAMESTHIELTYCADNWKALEVAAILYPLWYGAHAKKLKSKSKPENVIQDSWEEATNLLRTLAEVNAMPVVVNSKKDIYSSVHAALLPSLFGIKL